MFMVFPALLVWCEKYAEKLYMSIRTAMQCDIKIEFFEGEEEICYKRIIYFIKLANFGI